MEGMDELEDDFALKTLIEAVENQIVEGHPREAGLVLMALLEQGIPRADALTAMAEVLAEHIAITFSTEKPFDVNAYARALLALTNND
ncbi:MAG: hypothetical protein CVV10_00400 [Gammaproteobacteria bacterium HGW-Gammaproteobacteria-14]|nr:MAG: hypothetical protein CVV10_00400 [Gammaproteobacteria bacterium HGW-Gammaproteobacteria-14]